VADGETENRQAAPMNPGTMVAVRFLQDCDQFMGADGKTYPLGEGAAFKTSDIATIPTENASQLIGRGVAIDVSPPEPPAATAHRPNKSRVLDADIPKELKDLPQWVLWKYDLHNGKWTKVPHSSDQTWKRASTTDPKTWGTFDAAYKMYSHDEGDGIGFVFTPPFIGVDFDHVENEPRAMEEIQAFSSYAETSPSGQGYHVICKGRLPGKGAKKGNYEIYTEGRFFTVTGSHLEGTPKTVNDAQPAIDAFLEKHIDMQEGQDIPITAAPASASSPDGVEIIRMLENDTKATSLMRGDTSGYPSPSEADMALCCKIAFYTKDAGEIDCIFRQSGLFREKWNREDYRDATINKALARVTETWPHPKKRPAPREGGKGTPSPAATTDQTEASAGIHRTAMDILENRDPFNYIMGIYNQNHVGDTLLGKSYLAILGCTLCTNTAGIHPGTTGKSGLGKSHSMEAMLHLYPPEYVFRQGFSDLAWFYVNMTPGTVIFLDDAQNLKDIHKDIIKVATTRYQEGYERAISDPKMKKTDTLRIPPRCTFWINSVEGEYDLQFLNRQINLATNEKQTEEIYQKQLADSKRGTQGFPEDKECQIAREMHRILRKENPIRVMAPILDNIKWLNKENPRNYPMFVDTICGVTAINQFQREKDPNGTVIATREDVNTAMKIWSAISQQQRTKLSPKQLAVMLKIVELMRGANHNELLRTDLAKALPDLTSGDLTHVLKGRRQLNGRYEGGLLNLVPGLEITQARSSRDSEVIVKQGDLLIYNGDFDHWSEYGAIAVWKTPDAEK